MFSAMNRSTRSISGRSPFTRGNLQACDLDRSVDREAALKAASWGRFQFLESNFVQAGFDSVGVVVEFLGGDPDRPSPVECDPDVSESPSGSIQPSGSAQ